MKRVEAGSVLLEAIVALTILGSAGLALGVQVHQAAVTTRQVQSSERRIHEASTFLEAIALWPSSDLDLRLGSRQNGPWRLEIERSEGSLYSVSVRDSVSGGVVVATVLYRRSHAATR